MLGENNYAAEEDCPAGSRPAAIHPAAVDFETPNDAELFRRTGKSEADQDRTPEQGRRRGELRSDQEERSGLNGNGFEHSMWEIAPPRLQDIGDLLRKFDGKFA